MTANVIRRRKCHVETKFAIGIALPLWMLVGFAIAYYVFVIKKHKVPGA